MSHREYFAPGWQSRLSAAGLSSLRTLLDGDVPRAGGDWQELRKPGLGGRQRWRWELAETGAGERPVVFVKRYAQTPLDAQLDRICRQSPGHSRAWWEFHQSGLLAEKYIPAVRAVGAVEEMRGPLERRSAVLLESAGGEPLDRAWARIQGERAPLTVGLARHDFCARLGRFVAAFHQTGQTHRDLYLCHIFADLDPAGGRPPQFTLIDLARVHRPRWRRTRWFVKDLAQLDASGRQIAATRTDRLRVLLAYLGLERGAPRVRWWARRIVRKSDAILRRIARKSAAR